MVKISQIKYVRPDKDEVLARLADFKARFTSARLFPPQQPKFPD